MVSRELDGLYFFTIFIVGVNILKGHWNTLAMPVFFSSYTHLYLLIFLKYKNQVSFKKKFGWIFNPLLYDICQVIKATKQITFLLKILRTWNSGPKKDLENIISEVWTLWSCN